MARSWDTKNTVLLYLNLALIANADWQQQAQKVQSYLNIVLIAPLRREGSFSPGVVHRKQCNMVSHVPPVEVLMGVVSKDSFVLGSVEDATAGTHHGGYGHYLLRTLHSKGACWLWVQHMCVSNGLSHWCCVSLLLCVSECITTPKGMQVDVQLFPPVLNGAAPYIRWQDMNMLNIIQDLD